MVMVILISTVMPTTICQIRNLSEKPFYNLIAPSSLTNQHRKIIKST